MVMTTKWKNRSPPCGHVFQRSSTRVGEAVCDDDYHHVSGHLNGVTKEEVRRTSWHFQHDGDYPGRPELSLLFFM